MESPIGPEEHLYRLELEAIEIGAMQQDAQEVVLRTSGGRIATRLHVALEGEAGILWIAGAGGGFDGPAGGLYPRVARRLAEEGITSLRLHYRYPNRMTASVMDVLLGIEYLRSLGRTRIVLVGHSFGGGVAIAAAIGSEVVAGVVALSSQTLGTNAVARLSPRPLLLIHGLADEVLPAVCSQYIYSRALKPKRMLLYPGGRHDLDGCRERLEADLTTWLRDLLA